MIDKQHSEFEEEKKRLEYTKRYMEAVIQAGEQNKKTYKKNIRQAMVDLDYLDSSLSYINILTNNKFLEMASSESETLKRIRNKPYFARINFKKRDHDQEDIYYIGKTSLYKKGTQEPLIIDWRSPIANVYYDGRLGDVSYESNEGEVEGVLSLKRQFTIEQGELIDYRDVDLTTKDELLQEALAGKADNRLTEIVSTIQAEQNKVIRADLNRPIIVQGAAGSGKSTIALHRISYFIYQYAQHFRPEQLMIIAPNKMFIKYIAEVLPELGVERIRQTTYIEYVKQCIGKNVKVVEPDRKLISLINGEYAEEEMTTWLSTFKGSLTYKKIIDRYLKDIRTELSPTEDFLLEKFRLTSGKRLQKLFIKDYNYLPFYSRKEKIQNVLKSELRLKKKQILTKLEEKFHEALEKALYQIKDEAKRKKKVVSIMETKEKRIKAIEKEAKTAVKSYMNKIPTFTLMDYYKRLFQKETLLRYAEGILTEEQVEFFCQYNGKLLLKNRVEVEDLGALFYMQYKIFGIDKELKAKNVVIDEAQDYSHFQLYALKAGLETDMFTIVGDLAQGIHSYRALKEWKTLAKVIFPRANILMLQKSYRTTIDIMYVANDLLSLMKEDLPKVEPVLRRGKKPAFYQYNDTKDLEVKIQSVLASIHESGYKSIALIGKTAKECTAIYKLLQKKLEYPIQLLQENEEIQKGHLIIVPSYLSKGLEFDAVLIFSLDESYKLNELDIKLLYVAMTRPMHQLYLFARQKNALLLDHVKGEHLAIIESSL